MHALLHGVPDRLHRGVRLEPRGEASIAYSVSQLVTGATSPLVGVLVDRLGPRRLILMGGVLLAVGLVASAFANALWQVIVLYGVVMTLGANCLGLVVFVPILSRHFVRNRGMAVADRAVGQRLRPRRLGAAVAGADRRRSAGAAPIWRRAGSWRWRSCRWPRCSAAPSRSER